MFKRNIFIILFLLFPAFPSQSQNDELIEKARSELKDRGEIYLCFVPQKSYSIDYLSDLLSIARLSSDTVFAYLNEQQFVRFLRLKIPFDLLIPPSLLYQPQRTLKNTAAEIWESYPTYHQYIELMENYTKDFYELCHLVEIGESVGGKRILAVKISDDVNDDESEPGIFYTSTMHGDEPSGYILMLRLIDYILNSYGTESRITNLVDHAEIFINPLANPDGLYFSSDTSVWGARRFNLNNVDLNRNFPDAETGTSEIIQPETRSMMDFMNQRKIILSANFHDGNEVVNYPWDMWPKKHADDEWYVKVSRQYADTAHKYSTPGYMDDLNNGITNGYEWYKITGGRQDYVNYYLYGREVTIELSQERFPKGEVLDNLWEYNKNALICFMLNSFTGIRGTVTDSVTGKPLEARIFINDHDLDNSFVFSDKTSGNYYRMINGSDYNLSVNADGYQTKMISVHVPETGQTTADIELKPVDAAIMIYPNPFTAIIKILINDSISGEVIIEIFDVSGKKIINRRYEADGPDIIKIDAGFLNTGFYVLRVRNNITDRQVKAIKIP